ncbi:iron ABC transporter permease [Clostridium celatum]|uniref:FecCD family ABC transporter permease n=1 Tax=Clostridium celatum TaxID=36834 RepID=UPI0028FEFEFB|nr:iron ABC transporter permease [Clostridium celatum]MDU2265425.1 iron ABC transporter permease [Clostridium celatum]MDU6295155.1 iron ABC transporter permease [Clostridium celatum]MDY3360396.1 iron ABC transporter permease [Clostridium celatum]
MKVSNKKFKISFIVLSILILLVTVLVSLKLGSINITFRELIKGIFLGQSDGNIGIIKDLRMPRVIIAILVGANLAIAGVLLQAVIRNPLADPYITGISSGACVVTVFFMVFIPSVTNLRPIFGFFGGLVCCMIIYFMAYKNGLSPIRIVLAGAACNALLGGFSSMITVSAGLGASNIQKWMMGSLATVNWSNVNILLIYSTIGILAAILLSKVCNILALGSKNAKSLGFNSDIYMIIVTAVAVFLASISTAIAGVISFVGLVVPHICRIIIGSDHKYLIPCSGIVGAFLVLFADTVGRMAMRPNEIPVGVVTCIFGAPFFLYLLRRSDLK